MKCQWQNLFKIKCLTGNYIQYTAINHNGNDMKKNTYVHVNIIHVYISTCCAALSHFNCLTSSVWLFATLWTVACPQDSPGKHTAMPFSWGSSPPSNQTCIFGVSCLQADTLLTELPRKSMYLPIHIYVYIHMYVHINIYVYNYTYVYINICIYLFISIYMYISIYLHIFTYIYICFNVYVYSYINIRNNLCTE